jgi:cobalt-zinc-cadmium efflux system outer membrane protein
LLLALIPGLSAGCAGTDSQTADRDAIVDIVRQRATPGQELVLVPDTVALVDGLSEPEAIQLALVNNALFQELLVDLGLAHADLVQAGLLPNPEVLYAFPMGAKPFKYAVDLPIEAIVLRPARTRAASAEWERTRERLTQAGIDLVRDTRLAHADWVFARERMRIAEENLKLRDRIFTLAEGRLKAGDATPLEVSTAKIDSLRAKQEATRAINDVPIFEERLRNLTGLGLFRPDLTPEATEPPNSSISGLDALVEEAISSRPDVRSADHAIEAAEGRVRLAELGWLRILVTGDATSGESGHEFGPALRLGIPIFNWNQGGISRANADRERLIRQRNTIRERAAQEVRVAYAQHTQAAADYAQWKTDIRPAVDEAVRRAENTFKEGGTSLLLVLETSRQLIEARTREAQLRADLLRTWAELERSVGRKLLVPGGFATER